MNYFENMKLKFVAFLFASVGLLNAQTLTITTSGQTGTSGTNWSASGSNPVQIVATGTANIHPSVIEGYLNSGQSVEVVAPLSIAVNASISKSSGVDATLVIKTVNNPGAGGILFGSGISIVSTSGMLNIEIRTRTGSSANHAPINVSDAIFTTNSGYFLISGATSYSSTIAALNLNGCTITTSGGDVTLFGNFNVPASTATNYGIYVNNSTINTSGGSFTATGLLNATSGSASRAILIDASTLNVGVTQIFGDANSNIYDYTTAVVSSTLTSSSTVTIQGRDRSNNSLLIRPVLVSDITSNGQINVEGSAITVDGDLTTTSAGSVVILKSLGDVILGANNAITTNGGDVTLWADSDGSGAGYVQLSGGANSGITSGGGNVILGGGLDLATGFARGAAVQDAGTANTYISGVHLRDGTVINSGGGNITLRGQNVGDGQAIMQLGVLGYNTTLDAGSGKIAIYGKAGGSGSANAQAISSLPNGSAQNWIIRSSNTASDAIVISGDATTTNNSYTSLGINFWGTIEATGNGGGIQLIGTSGTSTNYGDGLDVFGNVLASSGSVTLVGSDDATNANNRDVLISGSVIGFKASTNVTTSSANVVVRGNRPVFASNSSVNTSGTFTLEPRGDDFGTAVTFPNSNLALNSSITGLTVGKLSGADGTSDVNVTIANSTSITGPLNIYGGGVNINENINTTAGGALGDVLIKASDDIFLASTKSITTNSGDITFWSDFDGSNDGSIVLNSGTSSNSTALITSGGNILLGGGSGPTISNATSTTSAGIYIQSSIVLNAGSGNVEILGVTSAANSYGVNVEGGGSTSRTSISGNNIIIRGYDSGGSLTTLSNGLRIVYSTIAASNLLTLEGRRTTSSTSSVANYRGVMIRDYADVSGINGVAIIGQHTGGTNTEGVYLAAYSHIYSSNGPVSINGTGTQYGVRISQSNTTQPFTQVSAHNGILRLIGTASAAGVLLADNVKVIATGTGKVRVSGDGLSAGFGVQLVVDPTDTPISRPEIRAEGDSITISGVTTSNSNAGIHIDLGSKIHSAVTTHILFRADALDYADTAIYTQGKITLEPFGNSFSAPFTWSSPSNLFAKTPTGLQIGKSTNTADVTIASALNIAGPITIYGGTITLNNNLTTTNSGVVSLYTNNALGGLSTSRSITAAGSFKYIPRGSSFSNNITFPITNLMVSSNGLTIGKSGNTSNVTLASDLTVPGTVALYGAAIALENNLICANLELEGTAALTSDKTIHVTGNLVNAGTLNLGANSSSYSQLQVSGTITNSGSITQNQYLSSTGHHGISSPMAGGFGTTSGTSSALYGYDAANGAYLSAANTTVTTAGAGYFAPVGTGGYLTAAGTFSATGTPNTSHTHSLGYSTSVAAGGSGNGWNLIGNPYTCGLDWTGVTKNSVNDAFYIWDPATSTYKYYVNGVSAPTGTYAGSVLASGVIPPMQAFWVQTTGAGASVVSTMASHGTVASSPTFYKTQPDNIILTVSNVSDAAKGDVLWVKNLAGTTNGFEGQEDAWKMTNYGGYPNIYTYDNGQKMAINATDLMQTGVIPVGMSAPSTGVKYTFNAEQVASNGAYTVILEDKHLNTFTNLGQGGYTFMYGDWNQEAPRFALHINQATVGQDEDGVQTEVKLYQNGDRLIIHGDAALHTLYRIISLEGRLISEGSLQAGMASVIAPKAGLYIVQLNGQQASVGRVIIQ